MEMLAFILGPLLLGGGLGASVQYIRNHYDKDIR